jgi:hypothetical protein
MSRPLRLAGSEQGVTQQCEGWSNKHADSFAIYRGRLQFSANFQRDILFREAELLDEDLGSCPRI